MKIRNTTKGNIGLDPETIIEPGQTVEIDDMSRFKGSKVVQSYFDTGMLVEVKAKPAPKPKAEPKPAPESKD
jgi:hypothetical protein